MNISYNWLKDYLKIDIEPEKLSTILTDIGLEVSSVEEKESIKGGLKGLVIGKVLTCEKHNNSDHLSVTTVDVGGEILPIVCGAPNVKAGQQVVVATVGTILYAGEESFKIKKSKIRGEVSEGMICAEDEIGLGKSHDGIMVLPEDAKEGTLAKDYFKIDTDIIFEIDLTPNRADATSHFGVARDLAAYLQFNGENIQYQLPDISNFSIDNNNNPINIKLNNTDACHRYAGLSISNITVADSPEWLQNKLKAIGLSPINNIVDITNFVLHELGQPLHAFDLDKVKNNEIIVDTVKDKTPFTLLDGNKIELSDKDLMISNTAEPMCIAGVMGGLDSGVTEKTTAIFLESAYFDAVWVRKTAKRHTISTDASFRFERGTDPNMPILALKRAALLIKEIAGGEISSEVYDVYPEPVKDFEISVNIERIQKLIGQAIPKEEIITILEALEIKVEEDGDNLKLTVPPYRVDVKREADIVEEILRIYGYNKIQVPEDLHSSLSYSSKPDKAAIVNYISDYLSANGWNEMMANSLTKASYYEDLKLFPKEQTVLINNPLSSDLNAMRQTLLFGALESVAYNKNHKNEDLKLYEWGNCSFYLPKTENENHQKNYKEEFHLSLITTGNKNPESWKEKQEKTDFFYIKRMVEGILLKLRIQSYQTKYIHNEIIAEGLQIIANNKEIVSFGILSNTPLKKSNLNTQVFYAEFNIDAVLKVLPKKDIQYKAITKFPAVRRDLSLLLDKEVLFSDLQRLALKTEKKLLKEVQIFDVYEGKNLPENKKSYALSFTLQDENKTLNDKQIEKIMQKILFVFEKETGAQLR